MPPGDIASKADDVRQDRIRHVEREVDQGKHRAVPDGPLGEVVCATRKPMKAGELIDGEGGYAVYGLSVPGEIARRDRLIPMGLPYGLMLDRDVDADHAIGESDVSWDQSSFLWKLRRRQEQVFGQIVSA